MMEADPPQGQAAPVPAAERTRGRTRSWLARQMPQQRPIDEDQARRYRQRIFQMGLLVCLLLLFIDQKNATTTGGNSAYGDSSSSPPSGAGSSVGARGSSGGFDEMMMGGFSEARTQKLNEFLNLQPGDGGYYAKNATGYYRGGWTRLLDAPAAPPATKGLEAHQMKHNLRLNSSSTSSLASSAQEQSPPLVTLHHEEGRFDMQLYMNSIPGVMDLSLVYGYFKLLDGPHSSERDVYSVAKGVYLHKTGRLLLRTMTQTDANSLAFTFTLPASAAKNSTDVTGPAAPTPPSTAAPVDAPGGGKLQKLQTWNNEEDAPAPAEKGNKLVQDAKARGRWYDDDDTSGDIEEGGSSRRRERARRRRQQRRRRKANEKEGVGRRLAAILMDAERDEEQRLLAALEEVMKDTSQDEDIVSVLGITVLDEEATAAGGEEHVAPDGSLVESIIIPNRSKNQYIRQTTTNGRKCVFTLDAHTLPRLNSTQIAERSSGGISDAGAGAGLVQGDEVKTMSATEDRLKWVAGLEGTLASPECNMALNISSEAIRLDWGRAYRKAVNYSIVVTLVCVLQIALLFRQLYYSRTQAAASRVSLLTVGQQAILDALLCIAHLLLCAMLQPLFAAFASIAFFKLVIFSIFEIRYMFIIHQSRNSQNANGASFNGLRRQLATLHARFYAILFFLLFLIYFLANYLEIIIFFLYSFWVPQIVMNAKKGIRHPLNRTYVVGMSLARLVIPLYIYGCPENFIHLLFDEYRPDYKMCALLVMWVGLQVAVLLSQDYFGPQYMVPARFLPPKYNYYRPIPQALRHRQSSGEEIEMTDIESGDLPECVICYNNIDVNHNETYMVSPCDHLFHRECLERWMDIKLECPVCRATLPMR